MRVLIVEDEPPIATSIQNTCETILKDRNPSFQIAHTLPAAIKNMEEESFDLCLLDLNLSGDDGFELLKQFTASLYTIIISAYSERAITAYEYGVIDFVPKPFKADRIKKAIDRFFQRSHNHSSKAQFIVIPWQKENRLVPISEIGYFKSARYLIEVHLLSEKVELVEKPLNQLEKILPSHFIRIHRSCIVDINQIESIRHHLGGKYRATLKNGDILPVNRQQYKLLKKANSP